MDKTNVIIPCWIINEELLQLTKNAIESLGDVFLTLIDNGSPLGGGYLRDKADIYIRNRENLGYAKAVNQGLKLVNGEMIAIANNDIRVSPNWQEVARDVLKAPQTYSCHFRMIDYDIPFQYGSQVAYQGMERWCTSSFFVIKTKEPFLYDENYLNSYDDWDMWHRVRQAGLKTAYTNKACYQHLHSSTQKFIPEREENNQKNREYFKKKFGDYAEDLFARQFPGQMKIPYWEGLNDK